MLVHQLLDHYNHYNHTITDQLKQSEDLNVTLKQVKIYGRTLLQPQAYKKRIFP